MCVCVCFLLRRVLRLYLWRIINDWSTNFDNGFQSATCVPYGARIVAPYRQYTGVYDVGPETMPDMGFWWYRGRCHYVYPIFFVYIYVDARRCVNT